MPTKTKPRRRTTRRTPTVLIKSMFLKPKPIKVVTRKVLENIADSIHDPKTGYYLNLCDGTLQNGPDPVCAERPMHCGLGELYYVVTGRQPEEDGVSESDVIDEIAYRSTIDEVAKKREERNEKAKAKIRALGLPEDMVSNMLEQMDEEDAEEMFREALNDIPNANDGGGNVETAFKQRAEQVAAQIRQAAALLPR